MAIILDGTSGATLPNSTVTGNLLFTGTGNRITGDFSNATAANRVAIQTSTVNGNTTVGFLPNGSGNGTTLVAFNGSDPSNANPMQIRVTASEAGLFLGANGTASGIPMTFWNGGGERVRIDTTGNVGIGATPNAGFISGNRLEIKSADLGTTAGNTSSPLLLSASDGNVTTLQTFNYRVSNGTSHTTAEYRTQRIVDVTRQAYVGWGSDYLAFGTSNTERMRIDNLGNVGIGTSSVANKFAVNSTTATLSSQVQISHPSNDWGLVIKRTVNDAGTSNLAFLKSRGETATQIVAGDSIGRIAYHAVTNTGTGATTQLAEIHAGNSTFDGTNADGYLAFHTKSSTGTITEKMRISPSGDIQIGSASADAGNALRFLDVYSTNTGANAGAIMRFITSNVAGTGITTVDMVKYKNGSFVINNNETNASANMIFGIGGTTRMTVDSSGNLLVGMSSSNGYQKVSWSGANSGDTSIPWANVSSVAINMATLFPALNVAGGQTMSFILQIVTSSASTSASSSRILCLRRGDSTWYFGTVETIGNGVTVTPSGSANTITLTFNGGGQYGMCRVQALSN